MSVSQPAIHPSPSSRIRPQYPSIAAVLRAIAVLARVVYNFLFASKQGFVEKTKLHFARKISIGVECADSAANTKIFKDA